MNIIHCPVSLFQNNVSETGLYLCPQVKTPLSTCSPYLWTSFCLPPETRVQSLKHCFYKKRKNRWWIMSRKSVIVPIYHCHSLLDLENRPHQYILRVFSSWFKISWEIFINIYRYRVLLQPSQTLVSLQLVFVCSLFQ